MTADLTAAFAVSGMRCTSCAMLVDDAVEALEGVHSSATHARRGRTVVRFDPTATSPEAIVAAIEQAGYRAARAGT